MGLGQAYAELKASTVDVASDVTAMGAQSTGGIIGKRIVIHWSVVSVLYF